MPPFYTASFALVHSYLALFALPRLPRLASLASFPSLASLITQVHLNNSNNLIRSSLDPLHILISETRYALRINTLNSDIHNNNTSVFVPAR